MTQQATPPDSVIRATIDAARRSPCIKSKRGATLFHPQKGIVTYAMWNSRPDNKCDHLCQPRATDKLHGTIPIVSPPSRCSMLCVHAEERAIRVAGYISERSQFVADGDLKFVLEEMELVHVKVNDQGRLVPSGGPSCWSCAKTVADTGLLGVWLYEALSDTPCIPYTTSLPADPGTWRFYTGKEFYELTMKECRLG